MPTFGRQTLGGTGYDISVSATGNGEEKVAGVTVDWSTVTAAPADATLTDKSQVKAGQKYLRFGQILALITATGLYGPYDPAAADGRQTLARTAFIVNRTTFQNVPLGLGGTDSDHPPVIDGGRVWRARLIATTGAASLASGPAFTNFEAAFPRVAYVDM